MSFISQHKLIIIIAVAVVALGVWYGLSGSAPSSPLITTTPIQGGADQELVSTLLALRAVKLDGTIFTDATFVDLRDFSTQIIPEPVGRPNPFAPISSGATTSASSAHDAELFTPPR